MKNKEKKSTKLKLIVANPPTKEQADKLIEHLSECLKIKYYS